MKRELNAPPCDMARARWAEADRESPKASERARHRSAKEDKTPDPRMNRIKQR